VAVGIFNVDAQLSIGQPPPAGVVECWGVLLLVAAARGRPTTVTARPRHPRYEIGRSISIVTSGTHQINP
jgi:hypothetical protein